jgi:hypothetical protein
MLILHTYRHTGNPYRLVKNENEGNQGNSTVCQMKVAKYTL